MTLSNSDIATNVVYDLLVITAMALLITWTVENKNMYSWYDFIFLALSLFTFLGTLTIYSNNYNMGYAPHYLLTAFLVIWLYTTSTTSSNCNPMIKDMVYKHVAFGLGIGAIIPILYFTSPIDYKSM